MVSDAEKILEQISKEQYPFFFLKLIENVHKYVNHFALF